MKERVPKMAKMVANAIKSLSEAKGSTPKEILNHITADLKSPDSSLQRQLTTALQRGVESGVFVRKRGCYSLNDRERPLYLDEPQNVVDACRSPRRPKPKRMSRTRSKCAPKARSRSRRRSHSARGKSAMRKRSSSRRRSSSKKRVSMCKPMAKRSRPVKHRRRSRSRSRVPNVNKCLPNTTAQNIEMLGRNANVEEFPEMELNVPEPRPRSRSHSRARSTHSTRSTRNHG